MNPKANHELFGAISATLKPINESAPEAGSFEADEAHVKNLASIAAAHTHIVSGHGALMDMHLAKHGVPRHPGSELKDYPEGQTNPHKAGRDAAHMHALDSYIEFNAAHEKLQADHGDKAKPASHYHREAHTNFTNANTKYYGSDDPMYSKGSTK